MLEVHTSTLRRRDDAATPIDALRVGPENAQQPCFDGGDFIDRRDDDVVLPAWPVAFPGRFEELEELFDDRNLLGFCNDANHDVLPGAAARHASGSGRRLADGSDILIIQRNAVADAVDDISQLRLRQLGMHWQRQRLVGGALALREGANRVAKVRKALLKVHWDGVIHLGAYAPPLESGLQVVAVRDPDDILIEDVAICRDGGRFNRRKSGRRG